MDKYLFTDLSQLPDNPVVSINIKYTEYLKALASMSNTQLIKGKMEVLIHGYNNLSAIGFTENRFFSKETYAKVNAIRADIEWRKKAEMLTEKEYAYLLTVLVEAMRKTTMKKSIKLRLISLPVKKGIPMYGFPIKQEDGVAHIDFSNMKFSVGKEHIIENIALGDKSPFSFKPDMLVAYILRQKEIKFSGTPILRYRQALDMQKKIHENK